MLKELGKITYELSTKWTISPVLFCFVLFCLVLLFETGSDSLTQAGLKFTDISISAYAMITGINCHLLLTVGLKKCTWLDV